MLSFALVTLYTVALICALVLNLAAKPKINTRVTAVAMVITGVGGTLLYSYGHAAVRESILLAVIRAAMDSPAPILPPARGQLPPAGAA